MVIIQRTRTFVTVDNFVESNTHTHELIYSFAIFISVLSQTLTITLMFTKSVVCRHILSGVLCASICFSITIVSVITNCHNGYDKKCDLLRMTNPSRAVSQRKQEVLGSD